MPIKVALVEDNAGVRGSLVVLIAGSSGFICGPCCATGESALKEIPPAKPDVVLMDIHLPQMTGIECVRQLKAIDRELLIVMLTVHEDTKQIFNALQAGASGYLLKHTPPAELLKAIEDVHHGGAPMSSEIARKVVQSFHQTCSLAEYSLSKREEEILRGLAQGYFYKEIASLLKVSVGTVNSHIRRIYAKLHVRSRHEALGKLDQGS